MALAAADSAVCACLLRENPLGPGRQHTRLDFMAGRLGPGVGVRIGWVAAQGAGFAGVFNGVSPKGDCIPSRCPV